MKNNSIHAEIIVKKNEIGILRVENVNYFSLTEEQKKYAYANEADFLNVALFGMTAKEWKDTNPKLANNGNIRDYMDLLHLVILNNLQNTNS